MDTYVTVPQLRNALKGSAGVGARTAADLPDESLAGALGEAHAEVLGKILTRYSLPVDPTTLPAVVRGFIIAVASYVATLEWKQGNDLPERDAVVLRYQRAQTMLRQITDGVLDIELDPAPSGTGDTEAVFYDPALPVNLAGDVQAPTYGGLAPTGWQGSRDTGYRVWYG